MADLQTEPVSDSVRSILDGHIVLDRAIAERGRFPAVNILRSVSRTMPGCNSAEENELLSTARKYIADYNDMEEMIRLGAYRPGANQDIDEAIHRQKGPVMHFYLSSFNLFVTTEK